MKLMSKRSIRGQVSLAVASMVAIILVAIFFIVATNVDRSFNTQVRDSSLQIAEARADQVDTLILQYQQLLRVVLAIGNPDALSDRQLEVFAQGLRGRVGAEINNVFIVWPDGRATMDAGQYVTVTHRSYYNGIFDQENESFVSDPLIAQRSGKPASILAEAIKNPDGSLRAALAFELSLDKLNEVVDEISIGEGSRAWVLDSTGTVIAAQNRNLIMDFNLYQADEKNGYSGLSALASHVFSTNRPFGTYVDPAGEKYHLFASEVSKIYNWRLGIIITDKSLNAAKNQLSLIILIVIAVALAAAVGESLLIGSWIAKPIKQLAVYFQELAEGEADLTKQLNIRRKDEIGLLVKDFHVFLEKLSGIIGEMKGAQGEIKSSGQVLAEQTGGASGQLEKIGSLVGGIQVRLQQQNDDMESSSAAVNQTANGIMMLDNLIADQSASIAEASSSIEEMVGNIASVSGSTEKIAAEFQNLLNSSEQGLATQNAAKEKISLIAEQSQSLMEANTAIGAIAAQTNLLAMNAAIEAAHAGEAGKGFSVVADEIRRLAETSSEQSRNIGNNLKTVLETISAVVEASGESERAFEDLSAQISQAEMLVSEVRAAMVEQKEGSEQILEAIKSMNGISIQVRDRSQEMSSGNTVVVQAIEKLTDATREIYENSNDIAGAVESVETVAKEIADVASQNEGLVSRMENAIGRFRV